MTNKPDAAPPWVDPGQPVVTINTADLDQVVDWLREQVERGAIDAGHPVYGRMVTATTPDPTDEQRAVGEVLAELDPDAHRDPHHHTKKAVAMVEAMARHGYEVRKKR